MECQRVQEKFLRYLDGDMRVGEQVYIGMHLDACPECRRELDALRRFLGDVRAVLRHPQPRQRWHRLFAAMEALDNAPRPAPQRRVFVVGEAFQRLAIAGLVVLGLFFSSPLMHRTQDALSTSTTLTSLHIPGANAPTLTTAPRSVDSKLLDDINKQFDLTPSVRHDTK